MVKLTINGRKIQAEEGTTILYAARDNNIFIPTLCENEAVSPYGACRICIAEITEGSKSKLVTSCTYQATEGLRVRTASSRVISARRMIVELLLASCPQSKKIQD